VTDDDALARRARSLRNQGRDETGAWLEHECLGHNYRMSEMSAALGTSQFGRLESLIEKRDRVARLYDGRLGDLEWVRLPAVRPGVRVSRFVYVVTLAEELDRDAIMRALERVGIPSRAYFPPLHLQPYVRQRSEVRAERLPVTESIARRTLALPFHGGLTESEVDRVVDGLRSAVKDLHG
jgi:perosamine synthetase